jgi:hypothetical protein
MRTRKKSGDVAQDGAAGNMSNPPAASAELTFCIQVASSDASVMLLVSDPESSKPTLFIFFNAFYAFRRQLATH